MNVVKIMKRENIWPEAKVRLKGTSLVKLVGQPNVRTVVYTVERLQDRKLGVSDVMETTRVATYYGQTCVHSVVVHTRWVNDE